MARCQGGRGRKNHLFHSVPYRNHQTVPWLPTHQSVYQFRQSVYQFRPCVLTNNSHQNDTGCFEALPITFYQTNWKLLLIQFASVGLLRERVSVLSMLLNIFIMSCGGICKIPSGLDYFVYIFSSVFSYLLNRVPCIDNWCVKKFRYYAQ